jgi:hypothetical protein
MKLQADRSKLVRVRIKISIDCERNQGELAMRHLDPLDRRAAANDRMMSCNMRNSCGQKMGQAQEEIF